MAFIAIPSEDYLWMLDEVDSVERLAKVRVIEFRVKGGAVYRREEYFDAAGGVRRGLG